MELCLVTDHACNLRCSYCYTGEKSPQAMSEETAARAVDFALARDEKALSLSFFGGEPTLRMGFVERVTEYATSQLRRKNPTAVLVVHLNTNATRIDERVEAFVRSCHLVNAFVSIDGPEQIHNRHRLDVLGRGSYASTRQGLSRLVQAGARAVVLAVINPDTAGSLGEIATELLSLPVHRANVVCNLRANWDEAALEKLRRGLAGAAEVWKAAFRAGKTIHFEPFTTKILSHLHAAMPCGSRCHLGYDELVVAPSGRLYSCGELVGEDCDPTFSIGDLTNGIDTAKLFKLREQKDRIEQTCAACELRERCSSACGCKHVALTGELGKVTQTLCDTEQAFIQAADSVAEDLYREQCDAFLEFFYRKSWAPSTPQAYVQIRHKA